uniref:Uncharacterized protein n=1 Tax=Rhizophora mucronata TaxID=61149 RepID=A0A2P2NS53_RHIMU
MQRKKKLFCVCVCNLCLTLTNPIVL